ncbi:MAG: hypothetical protein IJ404_01605 [Clostridia bacterium]|nr:hypothetical protein [Clostridia bacterium]
MSNVKKLYSNPDGSIVIENRHFTLTVGKNALAEGLILKKNGRDLLDKSAPIPVFSLMENRPFNNEIKLMYPNKRTVFGAKSVELVDGRIKVYFDLVSFGAWVDVEIEDEYVIFRLGDFIITATDFESVPGCGYKLNMDVPPVQEFRLLSLSVKRMKNFGQWLNVTWDDDAAVAVIGTSTATRIDHEKRDNGALTLTADAIRGIKLVGCSCALICTEGGESMLDAIDAFEEALDLPRGVKSRRDPSNKTSILRVPGLYLHRNESFDYVINIAKKCGITKLLFSDSYFFIPPKRGYALHGNYDYNERFPNGPSDVKAFLDKLKAEGFTPGLHFLQTHIGIESRYVTPVADHRLNLTRHFTLAKPLSETDTTVYVEEPTADAPMQVDCRVLQFGGELIHYESYTEEPPYAFLGCKRGHFDTNVTEHPMGLIGGTLDVSEFGATSVYVGQNSSLQDEVSAKLAGLYNCGFEFCYMDGSEGTPPPHDYHVSNAQYRTIKLFDNPPKFCEGAAKTHFGWHWMSGGNAFDVFQTQNFKKHLTQFPFDEAEQIRQDFTRVDFGWWYFFEDIEPDIYEFGISRAVAYDCPITLICPATWELPANKRASDNFEVIRRWEEYRDQLTEEQRTLLRDPVNEYTLLKVGDGLEMVPYDRMTAPEGITAYGFEHNGKYHVTLWHKKDSAKLSLACGNISYRDEYEGSELPTENIDGKTVITVSDKAYITLSSKDELVNVIAEATVI